jgi:tetratricopeptide (TPR) repeat protein
MTSHPDRLIGFEALERGDLDAAEAAARRLIEHGAAGDSAYLLGLVRWTAGDRETALKLLLDAAASLPGQAEIRHNLAVLLGELGRFADAAAAWREIAERDPAAAESWLGLAASVEAADGAEAAVAVFEAALALLPEHRDLLYNFADLRYRRGEIETAVALHGRLLARHPEFAPSWLNCAMGLKRLGRFAMAEQFYRRAMALPDPRAAVRAEFNLSNLLLLQGRWREGFAAYEARLRLPEAPRPEWGLPRWTGDEPAGCRVLLWSDQGFGDTILFLRYASAVAERGHRALLFVNDALAALAATAPGVEAARGLSGRWPEADAQLPLSSLPHVSGIAAPLWSGPYLRAADEHHRPRASGRKRVGIVWAGNPAQVNDGNRSLALADFAPLLALPDIDWHSLQVGPRAADLAASPFAARIADLAPTLADFAATARAMAALDLVISVDTAAAHLCGALGRPGWILLPHVEAYCFWGLDDPRTVWYPSLTLFRQSRPDDWSAEIARIASLLGSPGTG